MTESPQLDTSLRLDNAELFAKALELAPRFETMAQVARAVNDVLGVEMTDSAWRGLFTRNDVERERIRKRLGVDILASRRQRVVTITGNVRGVVTSDVHVPFHDANAVALATKLIKHYDPDVHIFNGDHLDFYNASSYDKNPARIYRLQEEIDQWHVEVVAQFNGASKRAKKVYIPGNHEDRLRRHLWQHPELFGIRALELPNLLELDRLGIEYAESSVRMGDLLEVSHGTRVARWSGMSAKAEIELRRFTISTITGHVHRAGRFQTHTSLGDREGVEGGCLCDLNPEYIHMADWTHALTFFEVRDGVLKIDSVPFTRDYVALYDRKVFAL